MSINTYLFICREIEVCIRYKFLIVINFNNFLSFINYQNKFLFYFILFKKIILLIFITYLSYY